MNKNKQDIDGKTFLITGGAGFIGSSMTAKLLASGGRVICFDNLYTGKKEHVDEFSDNSDFTFVLGDVNKYSEIQKVFNDHEIDYVIHYASVVGVKNTLDNPFSVLEDLEGIKNILKLSHEHGVKKALYASSSEVYGEAFEIPLREDHSPLNARLPYATVKSLGENYFQTYYEVHGLPTLSLRFFNVYGPRQESSGYGFVTAIFVNQVLTGQSPTIFGDGTQTRDFIFIEDNLEATVRALFNKDLNGTEINIGTGNERTILDLANKIIEISGQNIKPAFLPPLKKGDMPRRCPEVAKMKDLIGYEPQYSLEEGLKTTIDWYKNR